MQPQRTPSESARATDDPLDALHRLVSRLAEAVSVARTADIVAEEAARALQTDAVRVVLRTPQGEPVVRGAHPAATGATLPAPLAARVEDAMRAPDEVAALDARRLDRASRDALRGAASALVVPMTARRRTLGALVLALDQPRALDAQGARVLRVFAAQCAVALDRAALHEAEATWRAEAEAEVRRFRDLVQELEAIFWEADPKTVQFEFVSQRAQSILGYPAERWLEPGFWESIIHPEDRGWAVEFCAECVRDGEDHVFEYRLIASDGRPVWVRDVVYVVRDAQGEPKKLRGVMVDVSREREGRPADAPGTRARRLLPREDAPARAATTDAR